MTNGHKPHPFPYLCAIERLGIPPSQCLVFEDTLTGVRSGQAAGCPVVAIRSGITEHLPLLAPGDEWGEAVLRLTLAYHAPAGPAAGGAYADDGDTESALLAKLPLVCGKLMLLLPHVAPPESGDERVKRVAAAAESAGAAARRAAAAESGDAYSA